MFLKPWYRAAAMLEALEDAVLLAMFADIHANRTASRRALRPRARKVERMILLGDYRNGQLIFSM
jgi:hypothetical protein